MTTMTQIRPATVPTATAPSRLTVARRVFAGELVKLRTVRSTAVTMIYAALSVVGIGVANAALTASGVTGPPVTDDPVGGALSGLGTALIGVAVLGALGVTADYGTGLVKATVAAVPRRTHLVVGKAAALVAVVFPITLGSAALALLGAKLAWLTAGVSISLLDPGVVRSVVALAAYLSLLAVFTAGLGWLIRSTAGALGAWLGLWILPGFLVMLLPGGLGQRVEPYLPGTVGQSAVDATLGAAAAWGGLGLFALYAAMLSLAAAIVLRRRDV
jgi:ABC-2 type transport system permease protein